MIKYPESENGNMLLKRKNEEIPIDCMRVMLQKTRACPRAKINEPQDAVNLMKEMGDYERERGIILHLDIKNNVIGVENISIGSLNAAIIHPREALKGAILNSAAHIIFLHNHPSGASAPSAEDRVITKKLVGAFDAMGIDMLDSIIIGRESYYSFKEHGEMFPESKYKESRGEMKIMEYKDDNKLEEEDACSIATRAALEVITERCISSDGVAETDEPEEGRFLRLHIKQEIKTVHALARRGDSSVKYRAENTLKQIDIGVDNNMISSEFAEASKTAIQKVLK